MPKRSDFSTEAEWLLHLRLYFAAAALTGLLAKHGLSVDVKKDVRESGALAYAIADSMLAARDAGKGE